MAKKKSGKQAKKVVEEEPEAASIPNGRNQQEKEAKKPGKSKRKAKKEPRKPAEEYLSPTEESTSQGDSLSYLNIMVPPKERTFVFEDDYNDDPRAKLKYKAVKKEAKKLWKHCQALEQQLEDSHALERQQIQDQKDWCEKQKETFYAKLLHENASLFKLDAPKQDEVQELSEKVTRTKDLIKCLKQENAQRRHDNDQLRQDLKKTNQMTRRLTKATESAKSSLQELEQVHLVQLQKKNQKLRLNLQRCLEGHDKLVAQLERRDYYGETEHRLRTKYESTIAEILRKAQENQCGNPVTSANNSKKRRAAPVLSKSSAVY